MKIFFRKIKNLPQKSNIKAIIKIYHNKLMQMRINRNLFHKLIKQKIRNK